MRNPRASKLRPSCSAIRAISAASRRGVSARRVSRSGLAAGRFPPSYVAAAGFSRVSVLLGELGKPIRGRPVAGARREQAFQLMAFGLAVTPLGREPGSKLMDLGRRQPGGRQMRLCFFRHGDPVGRDAPVQSCAPGRQIIRAATQAVVEPTAGRIEIAGPDREVRLAQPDAIVVGSRRAAGSINARTSSTGVAFSVSSMCSRSSLMAGSSEPSPIAFRCSQRCSTRRSASSTRPSSR